MVHLNLPIIHILYAIEVVYTDKQHHDYILDEQIIDLNNIVLLHKMQMDWEQVITTYKRHLYNWI